MLLKNPFRAKAKKWEAPDLTAAPELGDHEIKYKIDWRTRHWTTGTFRVRRIKLLFNGHEYASPWVISSKKLIWRWEDYVFTQEAYVIGQPPKELIVSKDILRSAEYSGTLPIGSEMA